jgi:hypothetical protein
MQSKARGMLGLPVNVSSSARYVLPSCQAPRSALFSCLTQYRLASCRMRCVADHSFRYLPGPVLPAGCGWWGSGQHGQPGT